MTLNAQTKIGLTFGQIITIIIVVLSFSMSYANLTVRISALEQKTAQLDREQAVNSANIETVRTENREDHTKMMEKLDVLILELK